MSLVFSSATELAKKIKNKEVSAVEALDAFWSHSEKLNSELNAYAYYDERAKTKAQQIDSQIAKGEDVGPLGGVPISV